MTFQTKRGPCGSKGESLGADARAWSCERRAPPRGHRKTGRLTNRFALGVFFVALYVVVSAAGEVYAASYFQQADVFVALLLSFAVVCLMFNLLARHEGGEATVAKWSLLVFVALNVVTAISWIGLFIGLKYAEPAIVVAFMVALGPTATVWLNALIRRQGAPPASDIVVSVTIATIGSYMIWISASGNAGVEWGLDRPLASSWPSWPAYRWPLQIYLSNCCSTVGFLADKCWRIAFMERFSCCWDWSTIHLSCLRSRSMGLRSQQLGCRRSLFLCS